MNNSPIDFPYVPQLGNIGVRLLAFYGRNVYELYREIQS